MGVDKVIGPQNKNQGLCALGLMLKRQFFVLLLFLLVFFAVIGFEFSVVFGNKYHKIITIFLVVELVVLHKLPKFYQILKMNIGSLEQNEQRNPYDYKFIHPDNYKITKNAL